MTRRTTRVADLSLLGLSILLLACTPASRVEGEARNSENSCDDAANHFRELRDRMVREQIEARGVRDTRVLAAVRKVERHRFVPHHLQHLAYADQPLPIGHGQTISQPYIVAYMTEALELKPSDRVLEIGTGSGYQTAVLAELVGEVYSIEIVEALARQAAERLAEMKYRNLHLRTGNGYQGWPEEAPFDAIMVTAAPKEIPSELKAQLAPGGRLVVPVGTFFQELILVRRTPKGFEQESLLPVRFVPMVGDEKNAE